MIYTVTLLFIFIVQCLSIENCNKMWGMTNEINGVQVSKIGIYMCIEDPLNIYNQNKPSIDSNNIVLTNDNLNINNYNITIQKLLNSTNTTIYNYSNFSSYISPTPTTTTILSPTTTTTLYPTSTTTTLSPTTTTTTLSPTTISNKVENSSLLPNNSIHYDYLVNNNNIKKDNAKNEDDESLILIMIFTSTISICCCITCICVLNKKKCFTSISNLCVTLKKQKSKVSDIDVPKLQTPPKKIQVTPRLPLPKLDIINQETHIDIPRSLTPVNNQRLQFSTDLANITTPKTNEWYKNTFKEEINNYNNIMDNPPAPKKKSPKPYKQPINNQKRNYKKSNFNPKIKPNIKNKPGRKVPSKHEFRAYSNSWDRGSNKAKT